MRAMVVLGVMAAVALLCGPAWADATPVPATPEVGQTGAGAAGGGMPEGVRMGGRRRAPRQSVCAAEIAKFCSGVERGQGRYRECLTKHLDELSPACKEHVQSGGADGGARGGAAGSRGMARSRWQGACAAELEKFCKDVQPGRGRIQQCLTGHEAELGEACKDALQAGRGTRR